MKFDEFKNSIGKPFFSTEDILLRGLSVYSHQISLWKKQQKIVPLKRGLYRFADRSPATPEEIAFLLYEPSYISLETALSRYGFIPEIVYATTSVTPRINRKFTNNFGAFLYRHIQSKLFFGYEVYPISEYGKYLLAEPEKALLDFFYLNSGKIHSVADVESFRFNYAEISAQIDVAKFREYRKLFAVRKLDVITDELLQLCLPSNN